MRPSIRWRWDHVDRKAKVSESVTPGPIFAGPKVTGHDKAEVLSEETSQKIEHQADLRFAFGVAIALALPALIGMGVSYLLEGSVQKAGNRLRIFVQLIEIEGGAHVWTMANSKDFHVTYTPNPLQEFSIVCINCNGLGIVFDFSDQAPSTTQINDRLELACRVAGCDIPQGDGALFLFYVWRRSIFDLCNMG
jgi:hypothetical protein